MSRFPVILFLLASFSSAFSSRSVLGGIKESDLADAVVDLNTSSFDQALKDSPASFAVVEFFSHWCPACRNYKPQYEKVARLFNGLAAVHPGIVFLTRVDCAIKIHSKRRNRLEQKRLNALVFVKYNLQLEQRQIARRKKDNLDPICLSDLESDDEWITELEEPSLPQSEWTEVNECFTTQDLEATVRRPKKRRAQINIQLCDRFSVRYYPMLLWGPPSKFVGRGWELKEDSKSGIQSIDDGRTAERLLNWINKQLGSSFSFEDEKYENEDLLRSNSSDHGQIARAVYDIEEATENVISIIYETKMIKLETRAALTRFFQLLMTHHPSKRCRRGSAELLVNFDDLLPSSLWSAPHETMNSHDRDVLESIRVCGKEVPRGYWIFCRGSKNDTRGFSCGLWVLFHSLSVRVEDGESHLAFTAICEFIHNFFICEECRKHFYKQCSSVSAPLNTTRDFALWLWSTHNEVNKRLMKEEAELGTGDPMYPKIMWPPKQLCPSCYLSTSKNANGLIRVDWNREEVFKFLVNYYGKMLVFKSRDLGDSWRDTSSAEDVTATNAVTVPVGAALAIAIVSCGFGALAWFWRSQQKNRKPRRRGRAVTELSAM